MDIPPGASESYKQEILRERRVKAATALAPVVQVVGVVEPFGPSVVWVQGEKSRLQFDLVAWRLDGGLLAQGELRVFQYAARETLESTCDSIKPCTVITFRAHVLMENEMGVPHAMMIGLPQDVADAAFKEIVEELTRPVHVEHAKIGTFSLDRGRSLFEGEVLWRGRATRADVSADTPNEAIRKLDVLASVVENAAWWHAWVEREVEPRVMELLHEWAEEDFPPPTHEELLACFQLEDLSISEGGDLIFVYDFGDWAGGHQAMVTTTLDGELKDIDYIG